MKAWLWYAAALCTATFVAASTTAVPAGSAPPPGPAPGSAAPATLAPISDDQPPSPTATGTASPKVLGHVLVSAFCRSFVERFNAAAKTMIADDTHLDEATTAVRGYEDDFFRLDGALTSWNHRLQLIAALKELLNTIPKTQAAVNDLRAQAQSASDPERREALLESATQLQDSVDHQRLVANEMTDLVDMMLDLHTAEDTIGQSSAATRAPGEGFHLDAGDAPVPHPGEGLPNMREARLSGPSALEWVYHMPRDRQIIGNAEANAATAARRIVRSCSQDAPPAPDVRSTPNP
jgi:hypothetical protein